MRKIEFEADEKFVIALFHAESRQKTMEAILEVLPQCREDEEMYSLAVSSAEKLKRISDVEFRRMDLSQYYQEIEEEGAK